MPPSTCTRVILCTERPKGAIDPDKTFRVVEVPFDLKPADDEVLVRVKYLSLDPAMRVWVDENIEPSYEIRLAVGATMTAIGLGTVVEAGPSSVLKVGTMLADSSVRAVDLHVLIWLPTLMLMGARGLAAVGLTDYSVVKGKTLAKVMYFDIPPHHMCPSLTTADVHRMPFIASPIMHGCSISWVLWASTLKAGEVVVVTGAAGAVGSMACTLAKDAGARVYAIAGTDEKCAYLEREIGVEKALNNREPAFRERFAREVGAFDVFFDNVGGEILDFALTRMNVHARVLVCAKCTTLIL